MTDVSFTVEAVDKASRELNKVNQSLGGMSKSLLGPIAGYASLAGAVGLAMKVVKQSIQAYAESEKIMVRLNATMKSTGRSAEISSKQVEKMAGELSKLTGMDDEAIIGGYNALMKYESIPTGKMEEIVKIAADMSAAMGGDVTSNAEMLGRVLETGLIPRTWGFSAALKEQIQNQIKAGDSAGAMNAIMVELNQRFGGQAVAQLDTYAGRTQELATAWENYLEVVGKSPATFLGAMKALASERLGAATTVSELKSALKEAGLEVSDFTDKVGDKAHAFMFNTEKAMNALGGATVTFTAKWQAARSAIASMPTDVFERIFGQNPGVEIEATTASLDKFSETILKAAIGGKLDEMSASMAGLREEEADLAAQLEDTKPWETSKIEGLTTALDENRAKQAELSGAISEATQQLIFQQASAGLSGQALYNLANAMGVLDENSYALATSIATEKQRLDDGVISAATYEGAVRRIYDRYNELIALAASGPITVEVLTNWQNGGGGGGQFSGSSSEGSGDTYMYASGGSFSGWGVVGDAPGGGWTPYTEIVNAPHGATVYSAAQSRSMRRSGMQHFAEGGQLAGGGGNTVNLYVDYMLADNASLAKLERMLRHVRVLENGRRM